MPISCTFHKLSKSASKLRFDLLLRQVGDDLPEVLGGRFDDAFLKEDDKKGLRLLQTVEDGKVIRLQVISLPPRLAQDARSLKKALQLFRKRASGQHFDPLRVLYALPSFPAQGRQEAAAVLQLSKELLLLNEKIFTLKQTGHRTRRLPLPESPRLFSALEIFAKTRSGHEAVAEAVSLADAISLTRRLVNLPANRLLPRDLAEAAAKAGARSGFDVFLGDVPWIRQEGLEAYWQVARGSDEPPVFILMHYRGCPESNKSIALVGKGLCYDSGGYNLKEGTGMGSMFTDMGGAAAVIGALSALAEHHVKANVIGIVAACENMISGHAFRNGDIIDSFGGKTIEVISTDAEGRLTLADGVAYAWQKEEADAIIEISTLTGAVGVALGTLCIGALCDDPALEDACTQACQACGDRTVFFPCDAEFENYNRSIRADIRCGGVRNAGCIAAGLFVRAFAGRRPFLHLDIASTAYRKEENELGPAGATGVGCELLYSTVRNYYPHLLKQEAVPSEEAYDDDDCL